MFHMEGTCGPPDDPLSKQSYLWRCFAPCIHYWGVPTQLPVADVIFSHNAPIAIRHEVVQTCIDVSAHKAVLDLDPVEQCGRGTRCVAKLELSTCLWGLSKSWGSSAPSVPYITCLCLYLW